MIMIYKLYEMGGQGGGFKGACPLRVNLAPLKPDSTRGLSFYL